MQHFKFSEPRFLYLKTEDSNTYVTELLEELHVFYEPGA